MAAITHTASAHGAQVWHGAVGFARRVGELLNTLDAAIQVANAVELHRQPNPADLQLLGIAGPLPRYY